MGLNNSKPKKPPELLQREKIEGTKEVLLFSNGDKYEGCILDYDLSGIGTYYYRNNDVYKGEWKNNKKNGYGTHYYINQGKRYIGDWQDGSYHGHGSIYYPDESSFKGTFFEGEKNGIGHFQDKNGRIYEERWSYGTLKSRTLLTKGSNGVDSLNDINKGEDEEEEGNIHQINPFQEDRDMSDVEENDGEQFDFNVLQAPNNNDDDEVERADSDSENKEELRGRRRTKNSRMFETERSQTLSKSQPDSPNRSNTNSRKNSKENNSYNDKNDRFATGNALNSQDREFDSTRTATEFGLDTINIIEHMEVLNSAANYLLNKQIKDWSVDDVSDWIKHMGLGEYAEQFRANHITGANLLDLNDADFKQEFNICSLGHRKNLRRGLDQLAQIYRTGRDSNYVKDKIKRFYNNNQKVKKVSHFNSIGSVDGRFNSLRKLYSGVYNSTHEVIEEDNDEADMFSKSPPLDKNHSNEKKRSGVCVSHLKLDSQEKDSNSSNPRENQPRKQTRKHSFVSSGSHDSVAAAEAMKLKKKRSSASKKDDSEKEIKKSISEESFTLHIEINNKEMIEGLVKAPSPVKREDSDPKGKEEKNLPGNYLLHNRYDSHEHRGIIIANQNHVEDIARSYEGSSPTDSETSSSDEDSAKNLRAPIIRANTYGTLAYGQTSLNGSTVLSNSNSNSNASQSQNLIGNTLNQVLLGTTGNGQIFNQNMNYSNLNDPNGTNAVTTAAASNNNNNVENGLNQLADVKMMPLRRHHSGLAPETRNRSRHQSHHYHEDLEVKVPEGKNHKIDEQGLQGQGFSLSAKRVSAQTKKLKNPIVIKEREDEIREEILKILKETGLNENFVINFDELTIKGKIGEGGYGQVYEGSFSGTEVAIKEYGTRKLHRKAAEDFVKEVEVISSLRHPNIVLYMGACIHKGKYLMITEYLEHGSLFDHLHRKHAKLPEDNLLAICEDIALGMTYLHGRKVFHCDLKSSNILIDSNWSVKLCDFGLSRNKIKYNKKKPKTIQRIGTPHWMAPEILRGEHYDEFSDVYSYGMVLWEMITGEIPYFSMNVNEIVLNVGWEKKQVEIPTKGNQLILQIMRMCLSYEREKRPTFKEIIHLLQPKTKDTFRKPKQLTRTFNKK